MKASQQSSQTYLIGKIPNQTKQKYWRTLVGSLVKKQLFLSKQSSILTASHLTMCPHKIQKVFALGTSKIPRISKTELTATNAFWMSRQLQKDPALLDDLFQFQYSNQNQWYWLTANKEKPSLSIRNTVWTRGLLVSSYLLVRLSNLEKMSRNHIQKV